MKYDPDKHHRRSIRLKGYDYSSPGKYFITICCYQRQCLLGEIASGEMVLNELGQIVAAEWQRSAEIRQSEITLDAWVVMPNHIHGIVVIPASASHSPAKSPHTNPRMRPRSISSLISGFKSATTQINQFRNSPGDPVWQRNYYENIIRGQPMLEHVQQYIYNNPSSWISDQLHPANPSKW